mmetsp:Transcript_9/g.14  ORF Transcript_9/g.14 Transcript_9/m.14 type:complete len:337 (+) Transcript_9:1464-2474(+)
MFRIQDDFGPIDNMVLIMVKHEDPDVGMVLLQLWTQMVCQKVCLYFRRVAASFPRCREFRFILNCDGSKRNSIVQVSCNEFGKIQCPRSGVSRILSRSLSKTTWLFTTRHSRCMCQASCDVFVRPWLLHPTGRRPRGCKHFKVPIVDTRVGIFLLFPGSIEDCSSSQNHVDHAILLTIVRDIHVKIIELKVTIRFIKGVGFDGEITRIDVDTTDRVSQARLSKEEFHQPFLPRVRQRLIIDRGGLCKGSTKADDWRSFWKGRLTEIGAKDCIWGAKAIDIDTATIVSSRPHAYFFGLRVTWYMRPLLRRISHGGLKDPCKSKAFSMDHAEGSIAHR